VYDDILAPNFVVSLVVDEAREKHWRQCSLIVVFQIQTNFTLFALDKFKMLSHGLRYCTFDLKSLVVHRKNINDISMRSKTPSLAKMKRICTWKFVCSSYIG
jgi:hypothetical protein